MRKEVRRTINFIGLGLILYEMILYGVVIGHMLYMQLRAEVLAVLFNRSSRLFFNESYFDEATNMCLATLLGVYFLWLFFDDRLPIERLFVKGEKKMTVAAFFAMVCVFVCAQPMFGLIADGLESLLNPIGFSLESSVESASGDATTLSMFLYACVFAPVIEELVYRGFVMRSLEKYGKVFAIVTSAILFGAMHGNLPQAVFAAAGGLVLGYAAMEYSIVWSILLHFTNNCILGEVYGWVTKWMSEPVQEVLFYSVFGGLALIGAIVLIVKAKKIVGYLYAHAPAKKMYLYAFTTISMLFFLLFQVYAAISILDRI